MILSGLKAFGGVQQYGSLSGKQTGVPTANTTTYPIMAIQNLYQYKTVQHDLEDDTVEVYAFLPYQENEF